MAMPAVHDPPQTEAPTQPVVLFDGVCNLCNASVDFILRWERSPHYRFGSLQSDQAQRLLDSVAQTGHEGTGNDRATFGTASDPKSIVLVDEDGVHTQSTAALRISRNLRTPWNWFYALRLIPRPLRDAVYRIVARYRYVWFGRRETCRVPTPELRNRFLDD